MSPKFCCKITNSAKTKVQNYKIEQNKMKISLAIAKQHEISLNFGEAWTYCAIFGSGCLSTMQFHCYEEKMPKFKVETLAQTIFRYCYELDITLPEAVFIKLNFFVS